MSTKSLSLFDLAPGKLLLDHYTIVRTNRAGGMSATFEVREPKSKDPLEVQIFPAALFQTKQQSQDFARAMAAWEDVESKHVLAARDVETLDDGTVLFVTELPAGKSLRDWRKDGAALEPATVVDLGLQLLDGLTAIHARKLVHGDIKPQTVHVSDGKKGPIAVLVDGGITPALWSAKHLGDKTALIGTPFYAPVEQFGGESPDVQSDVYNVATVLYELACGVLPWKGRSFLEVFQAKLEPRPPAMKTRAPKSSVPAELEAVIVGGLMADRKERFGDAEAFAKKLKKLDL